MNRLSIARAFIFAGGVSTAGLLGGVHLARTASAAGADPYASIDTLASALHQIQAHYLEDLSTTALMYGAIDGMMDVLDVHSQFLDPDALEANEVRTEGVYSGVGVELAERGGAVTVIRTVPQSPSDGTLVPGDAIVAIDGNVIQNIDDASEALKGNPGTSVVIGYRRGSNKLETTLQRERIRDRTVRVSPLPNGWALAEISRFQRNTAADLRRGVEASGADKGLIVDLRGNGGGLLDEAIGVVDMFAERGLIVQTRGRDGVVLERHDATPTAPFRGLQLIILVDAGSASASEIVAGALRELSNAKLVGSTTFGKWSVQRVYVFEDKSALKLTVANYEIANRDSEPSGLEPDVTVSQPLLQTDAMIGLQKRLSGDKQALDWLSELIAEAPPGMSPPPLGPLQDRLTQDPQLAAAWTLALANR